MRKNVNHKCGMRNAKMQQAALGVVISIPTHFVGVFYILMTIVYALFHEFSSVLIT